MQDWILGGALFPFYLLERPGNGPEIKFSNKNLQKQVRVCPTCTPLFPHPLVKFFEQGWLDVDDWKGLLVDFRIGAREKGEKIG